MHFWCHDVVIASDRNTHHYSWEYCKWLSALLAAQLRPFRLASSSSASFLLQLCDFVDDLELQLSQLSFLAPSIISSWVQQSRCEETWGTWNQSLHPWHDLLWCISLVGKVYKASQGFFWGQSLSQTESSFAFSQPFKHGVTGKYLHVKAGL